jgi:RNA polymerase sigma factor (sigma-70 family)
MTSPGVSPEAHTRFESLYLEHYRSIYGYVRRRVLDGPADCDDLVADIFAVSWRRLDEVPPPPEERLWLFGVARRRLLEHHRHQGSRIRLLTRLAAQPTPDGPALTSLDPVHLRLGEALGELRPLDKEVLLLVVWDGLGHAEAAAVLGCSVNAIALRLKRAKFRLRGALQRPPSLSSTETSLHVLPTKETP